MNYLKRKLRLNETLTIVDDTARRLKTLPYFQRKFDLKLVIVLFKGKLRMFVKDIISFQ